MTYQCPAILVMSPRMTEKLYLINKERTCLNLGASRSHQVCLATLISCRTELGACFTIGPPLLCLPLSICIALSIVKPFLAFVHGPG